MSKSALQYGFVSRFTAMTVVAALVMPAPVQAWAYAQENQRRADQETQRFLELLRGDDETLAQSKVPMSRVVEEPRVSSDSSEVLSVPLLPKRVQRASNAGLVDDWDALDGRAHTTLRLETSDVQRLEVELPEARSLSAVTILGPTRGWLSVRGEGQGVLVRDVRVEADAAEWVRVPVQTDLKSSQFSLEWTPESTSGPAEIHLWGRWVPPHVTDSALADRILGGAAPGVFVAEATQQRVTAARATLGGGGVKEGKVTVNVAADPRSFARAFLVYELTGVGHFTQAVRRINGSEARGGEPLTTPHSYASGGLQVEEISPEWLRLGANTIEFLPLPSAGTPEYSVQHARIVGTPHAFLEGADIANARVAGKTSKQRFDFDATSKPHDLVFELLARTKGHIFVWGEGQRLPLTVDLSDFASGWHRVSLDAVPTTRSVEVSIDRDAGGGPPKREGFTPSVGQVLVTATPTLKDSGAAGNIVVSYPLHGECRNGVALLMGFVSTGELSVSELRANGQDFTPVLGTDNSFALRLAEPRQYVGKSWTAKLEAVLSDGSVLRKETKLAPCADDVELVLPDTTEDEGAPYAQVIRPTEATTISFAGVKLEIPKGAVDRDVRLTIRPLVSGQVAESSPRVTNVSPEGRAYRFGPHGLKFKKPIKVTLPYDPRLLKHGQKERDVLAFYYDEPLGSWQRIGRYGTARGGTLTSLTDHFTDFMNGVLAMPDEPGLKSFNANEMKDIKVADPGAGVALVSPPAANSSGSAQLSYPIELPPGRRGVEPSLAFTYSSAKGNGWLGVGWDLALPAIEIDTRFGVPRYDESEPSRRDQYLLNGEAIVPVGSSNEYVRRVEGPFEKIERNVTGLGGCVDSWSVIDKQGTVYTYGGVGAVLADPANDCRVFRWAISSVQDPFGNRMQFEYDSDVGLIPGSSEPFAELYPAAIEYTSHVNGPGVVDLAAAYRVRFVRDTVPSRADVQVNGRPGFQQRTRHRLAHVDVELVDGSSTTLIRRYQLKYADPTREHFFKSLLSSIGQQGVGAVVQLDQHTFEYGAAETVLIGNQVGIRGFGDQEEWGLAHTSGALSRSEDEMAGGSGTLGIGFPIISLTATGGGSGGTETSKLGLLDLNGDGLPDFVQDGSARMNFLRPELAVSPPAPAGTHFVARSLNGLESLGHSTKSGWSVGGGISVGGLVNAAASYSETSAQDDVIMTDIDGDGLTDRAWVSNGKLQWARNNGANVFAPHTSSANDILGNSRNVHEDIVEEASASGELARINPLVRWTAPVAGPITIHGPIVKHSPGGNGVDVSIFKNKQLLWSKTVAPTDLSPCEPVGNLPSGNVGCGAGQGLTTSVLAGDSIYFMASPHHDPNGPSSQLGLQTIANRVDWNPTIRYDGTSDTVKEPFGLPVHLFSQETDFRQWWPEMRWVAPAKGTVHVRNKPLFGSEASKQTVSDDVVIRIRRHPADAPQTTQPSAPFELPVAAESTAPIVFDEVFDVEQGDSIVVEVVSQTPIELGRLKLAPTVSYVEEFCRGVSTSEDPHCGAVTCVAGPPVSCTIAGDPDGEDSPISERVLSQSLQVAYLFPEYKGEATEALVAAAPETVDLYGVITVDPVPTTTPVVIAVQGIHRLYFKDELTVTSNSVAPTSIDETVVLAAGDQLMVTAYVQGDTQISYTSSLTANGVPIPITVKRLDNSREHLNGDGTPYDPMSGGFHGWYAGFFNGDVLGGFDPDHILFPLNGAGQPRHNPTRFFLGVPVKEAEEGLDIWSGPGGASIAPGSFTATRGNAQLGNSIAGIGALRHSSTWNFDLSLSVSIAGAAVNQGRTRTDRDFFDFNGDRFPDAVNADGTVQYGNGSGGFSRSLTVAGIPDLDSLRRVEHGTLRANLDFGDIQLINDTRSDGTVKKTLTTGFSVGTTYGISSTNIDWVDVNGDGLPDAVERGPDQPAANPLRVRFNYGYRLGEETLWAGSKWTTSTADSASGFGVLSGAASGLESALRQVGTQIDINGLRLQDNASNSVGIGAGGSSGGIGAEAGGGFTFGVSRTLADLIDINGDGLPDRVVRVQGDEVDNNTSYLRVRLNLGDRFETEDTLVTVPNWDDAIDTEQDYAFLGDINNSLGFGRSKTYSASVSAKVCFFICVGASGYLAQGSDWTNSSFEDIDGDGRPDMVFKSTGNGQVYAKLNALPKNLNLLKKVHRPLGGSFEVEYERSGNLVRRDLTPAIDSPSNQYVMSRVDVADGQGNHQVSSFSYDHSGFYDRGEREDYGFSKVTTRRLLQSGATYSSEEVNYNNQDFYKRGLVSRNIVRDGENRVYTIENVSYETENPACSTVAKSRFPRETTRVTGHFEGSTTSTSLTPAQSPCTASILWESNPSAVFTCELRIFDCRGNLTNFTDRGDSGGLNQVSYEINYADLGNNTYKPNRIRARDRAQQVIRERKATYDSRGALLTFTSEVIGGQDPVTSLTRTGHVLEPRSTWTYEYDAFGNVEVFADPKGYTLTYEYDPVTRSYRTKVQDSFGYTSTSVPDLRFGVVAADTDLNLNITQYSYDDFGRLVWVKGPYDSGTSNETISFSYSQVGVPVTSGLPASNVYPSYALTSHRSEQHPTQPVITATFADGLDRLIQMKKTVVRDIGNGPELGMSVSGEVVFDEMGRLIGQYQPYFDTSAPNVLAPPPQDPILAVVRGYDVLDRETAVRTPIAPTPEGPESYSFATTTTTYSIGKINTTARLMATISDPNVIARGSSPSLPGYARDEYRGVRGHLLRVVEKNRLSGSGVVSTLPTSYGYNALGELTSVTDSNGNITVATYDTAGRIVTLISPDAGRTDYLFDIAGNLAAKQTANLAYGFQRIYYDYDYNRLKKIDYPNSADVTFTYGAWTEAGPLSFYRASRIKQETSEAGTKSFRYELLGNINEETWSLNSLGSGPPVERTFRYNYDSFGRLLAVHYPGASEEVVNYSYDVGGNLDAVTGITGTGIITPYVQHIGYDEFEQKTSITLGNGITTYYSYDPYTRRLAGVSSSHRDPALVQAGAPARPFQQITYAYDPVGNLLEVANNAPVDPSQTGAVKVGPVTETFTYDDLYQLKTADGILQESETQQHRYGISFTYDLLSNVTSKTQLSETDTLANGAITSSTTRNDQTYTSTYTYPAGSRPHAVAQISDVVPGSGTVARTFTYDRNGNQKTWQRTSGPSLSRTTTYDDGNRVVSVSQNGATLQESLYDGAGQRLVKRANQSAETAYFGQYLTVRDNIPTTKHILAGGMRVASKFVPNDANEECAACPDRPSVTYFHSDHLGSTSFATDEEQTLLSRQHYFPSGELWLDQTNSLTAAQQPYLFSGKELDVETGLYYFGARYYDPRAGLWTTPDPILLQYMLGAPNSGVHFPRNLALYTYAINNPVIVQDSDGRAWWTKALKVGKALYKGGDMAMAFADAIENYNTVTNANASTGERVWAGVQLLSEVAPISVSDIKDAGRIVGVVDKIGDAGKGVKQAGNVGDAGKRLPADPPKMLPERAGPTGQISPSEVSGKTPAQIDARARELGLEARGPDPAGGRGAYIDPQTGKQRILSHPNGSPPHGHVNNPAGERIGSDGRVVPPESPEAHLPIKVE